MQKIFDSTGKLHKSNPTNESCPDNNHTFRRKNGVAG
jgi:hypothetical protein